MKKIFVLIALILILSCPSANKTAFASETNKALDPAAMERIIESFMFETLHKAVEKHYGAPRSYSTYRILSIKPVSDSFVYEIVIQIETFTGAHNPPYGKDTVTFWLNASEVDCDPWLKEYKHEDIPTLS